MSDLRTRVLRACTLAPGGVTGVTHVTAPSVTPKKLSSYNGYAGYAFEGQVRRNDAPGVGKGVTARDEPVWDTADWQAYCDERAAVREYDGGLPRGEAERLAYEDTVTQWLCLHPAPASDPRDGCSHCGADERPSDGLVAVLAAGGHRWVHDTCWRDWQAQRRNQASMALQQLGLGPAFTPAAADEP
jgi:hypothetical protein